MLLEAALEPLQKQCCYRGLATSAAHPSRASCPCTSSDGKKKRESRGQLHKQPLRVGSRGESGLSEKRASFRSRPSGRKPGAAGASCPAWGCSPHGWSLEGRVRRDCRPLKSSEPRGRVQGRALVEARPGTCPLQHVARTTVKHVVSASGVLCFSLLGRCCLLYLASGGRVGDCGRVFESSRDSYNRETKRSVRSRGPRLHSDLVYHFCIAAVGFGFGISGKRQSALSSRAPGLFQLRCCDSEAAIVWRSCCSNN